MTPRTNWAAGFMAVALFFAAQSMVTGPSDTEAAADVAAHAQALATDAAQIEADAELAVRQACAQMHGSRAQVLRIADTGDLVCRRRGVQL